MQVLTFSELSKRWKISRRSIERGVARGEFPKPMRIGGSLRFPLAAVEEFERRRSAGPDPTDAFDAALATIGDKLLSFDGEPGNSTWSRREAAKYRDLLGKLETLDEPGVEKLAKLAFEHGVDSDHLELHFLATRLHAEVEPIAAELPERQAALSKLAQSYNAGLGTIDETVLQQQTEARNRVAESQNAAKIIRYVEALFSPIFGAKPTRILEPRTGLISRLLNRAAELGLRDELLDSLTGEASDDAVDDVNGTPPQPWWQNRKLPDTGDKPEPSQERAMSL